MNVLYQLMMRFVNLNYFYLSLFQSHLQIFCLSFPSQSIKKKVIYNQILYKITKITKKNQNQIIERQNDKIIKNNNINPNNRKSMLSNYKKQSSYYASQDLPVDSTMKRLSQKISDMSKTQLSNMRTNEITTMQNRVQDIQNKIQQSLKTVEKTIKLHKESLIEMNQKLSQIDSRNLLSKKVRNNEIKQLQTKITLWVNMEKKARITIEDKILETFQEKFQLLSLDLSKQIENRKIYLHSLDERLAQTLPILKNEIVEELHACNAALTGIQNQVQSLTEEFKQNLSKSEEEHNKKMGKIMELLGETVNEVKKQINEERCQRESKKNQILQLFQGAYKKLLL